jgi:hypothetical protein
MKIVAYTLPHKSDLNLIGIVDSFDGDHIRLRPFTEPEKKQYRDKDEIANILEDMGIGDGINQVIIGYFNSQEKKWKGFKEGSISIRKEEAKLHLDPKSIYEGDCLILYSHMGDKVQVFGEILVEDVDNIIIPYKRVDYGIEEMVLKQLSEKFPESDVFIRFIGPEEGRISQLELGARYQIEEYRY